MTFVQFSNEEIERKLTQVKQASDIWMIKEMRKQRRLFYYSYLKSDEWKKLRRIVFMRCKGICEQCGVAQMEATHHKTYKRLGHELLEDLLGVCDDCHKKIHKIKKDDFMLPLVFGGI